MNVPSDALIRYPLKTSILFVVSQTKISHKAFLLNRHSKEIRQLRPGAQTPGKGLRLLKLNSCSLKWEGPLDTRKA